MNPINTKMIITDWWFFMDLIDAYIVVEKLQRKYKALWENYNNMNPLFEATGIEDLETVEFTWGEQR